jgi:hypothetical protein
MNSSLKRTTDRVLKQKMFTVLGNLLRIYGDGQDRSRLESNKESSGMKDLTQRLHTFTWVCGFSLGSPAQVGTKYVSAIKEEFFNQPAEVEE